MRWTVPAFVLFAACGEAPSLPREPTDSAPSIWFEECARARGLDFTYRSGHAQRYLFPEIMGGGAALFDMDGDGDLDAYCVQGGDLLDAGRRPGNQLFRNRGDGTFEDVTEGSGADDRGYGMGVAAGDYDGDGDVDLYVTNVGPNALLRNDGSGHFLDVAGVAGTAGSAWNTSAAFLDYDADGDLDLFAAGYVRWSAGDEIHCEDPPHGADYCSPNTYAAPLPDVLYRNEGDGTFRDVSFEAGLRAAFGNGLGVVCADFDDDGLTDVFVANDQMPNQLWHNLGDGTFRDDALLAGCAVDLGGAPKAGMGVAAADVDEDGDEDLLVVNLAGESDSFFRNERTHFTDRTPLAGLALPGRTRTRFGCGLVDFDNDGRFDIYAASGRVTKPAEWSGADPYAETDLLLAGAAEGRFAHVAAGGAAWPEAATGRAAAFGDVDGDGGVDVLVVNRDGAAHLLRNVAAGRGHWIRFRVLTADQRDALGARLTIRVGDRTFLREVRSAYGYCAANDAGVHVGLGSARTVDEISVRWPDAQTERFGPFDADRTVALERGAGER